MLPSLVTNNARPALRRVSCLDNSLCLSYLHTQRLQVRSNALPVTLPSSSSRPFSTCVNQIFELLLFLAAPCSLSAGFRSLVSASSDT